MKFVFNKFCTISNQFLSAKRWKSTWNAAAMNVTVSARTVPVWLPLLRSHAPVCNQLLKDHGQCHGRIEKSLVCRIYLCCMCVCVSVCKLFLLSSDPIKVIPMHATFLRTRMDVIMSIYRDTYVSTLGPLINIIYKYIFIYFVFVSSFYSVYWLYAYNDLTRSGDKIHIILDDILSNFNKY